MKLSDSGEAMAAPVLLAKPVLTSSLDVASCAQLQSTL